jgi:hypothetical protein
MKITRTKMPIRGTITSPVVVDVGFEPTQLSMLKYFAQYVTCGIATILHHKKSPT